jgi:hypothetical protein
MTNTETRMDIDSGITTHLNLEITHPTSWHVGHYRFVGESLIDEHILTFRAWMESTEGTDPPAFLVLHKCLIIGSGL